MLNLMIQVSMLMSGLLINFITPMVFGISAYGEFIAANALVFLIHKTIDIISEPLIRFTEPAHLIFVSLVFNTIVIILFFVLDELLNIGSSPLLLAMLLSSSIMLSLHALARKHTLLMFQCTVIILFILLLLLADDWGFSIEQVMQMSTLLPAAIAIAYIVITGAGLPTGAEFRHVLVNLWRNLPQLISLTAVYNSLTNVLPLILSFTLNARDLGIFKVATSVVQSASALFPINIRAIFMRMAKDGDNLFPVLSRVSLFYFSVVGIVLLAVGVVWPHLSHYVALAALFPTLYWAMLAERYWISRQETKITTRINLVGCVCIIVIATQVDTLDLALLLYASSLAFYALCLALLRSRHGGCIVPILASAPCVVFFGAWIAFAYLALVAALQLFWNRLNFHDIRLLSRSI